MEYSDDMVSPTERDSNPNKEYENKNYCRCAAEKYRALWEAEKHFNPGSLRHYGVRSDSPLIRFLDHARLLNASFGTFSLGFCPEVEAVRAEAQDGKGAPSPQTGLGNATASSWERQGYAFAEAGLSPGLSLFEPILQETLSEAHLSRRSSLNNGSSSPKEELGRLWGALQESTSWAKSMCGVVTVPHWDSSELRQRLRQQLHLAAFIGLFAVQIPLPLLTQDEKNGEARSALWMAHNWALLGHATDALLAFIQASNGAKIWVRCDACQPEHLAQYHRLHQLILYGYERDPVSKEAIGPRQGVTADNAAEVVCREAIASLMPMLYFSSPQESIISAWLGEDVSVFEPPPAEQLHQLLQPTQAAVDARDDLVGTQPSVGAMSSGSRYDYSFGIDSSRDNHSVHTSCGIGSNAKDEEVNRETQTSWHADPCCDCTEDNVAAPFGLQGDLLSKESARWGGLYPSRVSLITFLVELMRHRSAPIFSFPFFDDYAIMTWLHSREVIDFTRDSFGNYEDTLQLPLQPLSQPLPNAVYHIFECDSTKYSCYRHAVLLFLRDWKSREPAVFHHGVLNSGFVSSIAAGGEAPRGSGAETTTKTVYVVLLGCGRGGIVDEILSAASTLGLRLRLFAIEQNAPAAELTQLRWLCDPEWRHQAAAFDHTLEVIVGDARHLLEDFDKDTESQLPKDFGVCDLLVSEMLGSFGDNELSPECIEAFHNQLLRLQAAKGILPNANLVSIPQSYTTWVAPLHSTRIEQCVLDTAVRGLTVRPPHCPNRHIALFSSPMVTNLTRGVLLAPPQPCWTFSHGPFPNQEKNKKDAEGLCAFERSCSLRFDLPAYARCAGMIGFFSCLLYRSEREGTEVGLSTEPRSRTPGMYSWFPGYLPFDPHQPLQSLGGDASEMEFHFRRRVDVAKGRVWYSWGVGASRSGELVLGHGTDHGPVSEGPTVKFLNEGGWAASMLL